jgi:DNA-binding transcriptional MerR regulator
LPVSKSETALRTISELADELGIAQHILRYWETRFPQLRPLTRAGNRRYYRPEDVALARRIHELLNRDGFTIKGAQQALSQKRAAAEPVPVAAVEVAPVSAPTPAPMVVIKSGVDVAALRRVRDHMQRALLASINARQHCS